MDSLKPICENKLDSESLQKSGKPTDVVLVVGGKEFSAHKVVLSARSPVFAAMFAHDSTKEEQVNRVEITDVDVDVLKLMVRYMYTGKVDPLGLYAAKLLVAADKYQMASLKSICEQQLLSQITAESFSNLFILVNMYQATELDSKLIDFSIENAAQVIASKGWKTIVRNDDLYGKLMLKLFLRLHVNYTKLINENDKKVKSNEKKEDKCQLICLKSVCVQQLLTQAIATESVSTLLILADKHQICELTSKCVDYITDNVTEVLQQEDWKKIAVRADLVTKLFERLNLKFTRVREKILEEQLKKDYDAFFDD